MRAMIASGFLTTPAYPRGSLKQGPAAVVSPEAVVTLLEWVVRIDLESGHRDQLRLESELRTHHVSKFNSFAAVRPRISAFWSSLSDVEAKM